jgi:hypothetical protein
MAGLCYLDIVNQNVRGLCLAVSQEVSLNDRQINTKLQKPAKALYAVSVSFDSAQDRLYLAVVSLSNHALRLRLKGPA